MGTEQRITVLWLSKILRHSVHPVLLCRKQQNWMIGALIRARKSAKGTQSQPIRIHLVHTCSRQYATHCFVSERAQVQVRVMNDAVEL
jgi:hypothetical protein